MTTPTIDVLIAGAGPVGSALAIDLARRGLSVRIIDKADHGFDGSRAKGVQPRTLEVLDDLGALDDVLAGGSTYPLMGIHFGPVTVPWRMMGKPLPATTCATPHLADPPVPHRRALHDRLEELGVNVEYHHELVDVAQTAEAVSATVHTADGVETITARYLVSADGGGSTVRKLLDIGFSGSTDEADRMLIVDADARGGLSRDPAARLARPAGTVHRRVPAAARRPVPVDDPAAPRTRSPPETEDQITRPHPRPHSQ